MCCTFNPDCRYDNSFNVHKNTFQSLERSDYQCPQVESMCQVRNFPSEQQTVSFFLKSDQGIYIFEAIQSSIRDVIGHVYCPTCQTKSVFTSQPTKTLISTTVKSAKPALTCSVLHLRTKNQQYLHLVEMVLSFARNVSRLRKRKTISIFEEIYPPTTIKHTRTCARNCKIIPFEA